MRADSDGPPRAGPLFVRPGEALPRGSVWIELEGGGELAATRTLPRDAPLGYHVLRTRDGDSTPMIVSPGRCHLPDDLFTWGWAAQLYAVRSRNSWGMGDLHDLREVAGWSARLGAGLLLVNPLHAAVPGLPQEPSPYYPSSRVFRNPLYIAVDDVPGARRDPSVQELARAGRALNAAAVIDRNRIYELKLRALEILWAGFTGDIAFERYCAQEGETLERYACFCALMEEHRRPWTSWPQRHRSPDAAGVRRFANEHRSRVDFHRWLQWLIDTQLSSARRVTPLMHDIAVGFAPDGADAWLWQDVIASDASIGAPPDEFTFFGQDWGLPPFDPHRLRAAGYRPLVETLRRAMRHGAGVRIDHVMAMFRLWWIPAGAADPRFGAYVRYPAREMLDVLALESTRAGCYVVGEDLGTVEAGVRAELYRRGALSYRVAWFESRPPQRYPTRALAAMSTHDLPTVAGLWTGDDVREMAASGEPVNEKGMRLLRKRLARLSGCADDAAVTDVIVGVYAALAQAPSALVVASLDDATGATRRPNLPRVKERPNWSLPLPRTLEQIRRDALPRRIARALEGRD